MSTLATQEHHVNERDARRRLYSVLLRRIGGAALLVAAVLAALVYSVEQRRLRGVAVDLAVQRTAQFADLAGDALAVAGMLRSSEVQARLDRFVRERLPQRDGRIAVARIYAGNGAELAHYEYPEHPQAAQVAAFFHEKFDGGGYGNGLKAGEIPLIARIFAIVDVYDALTSRRPYKEPLSYEAAMDILQKSRGTHFDPDLLYTFAGIAPPLHKAFANRDDDYPRQVLRDIVIRYFKQDIASLF